MIISPANLYSHSSFELYLFTNVFILDSDTTAVWLSEHDFQIENIEEEHLKIKIVFVDR